MKQEEKYIPKYYRPTPWPTVLAQTALILVFWGIVFWAVAALIDTSWLIAAAVALFAMYFFIITINLIALIMTALLWPFINDGR